MIQLQQTLFRHILWLGVIGILSPIRPGWALPPPEDIPDEVLRTDPVPLARSAVDNRLLSIQQAQVEAQELAENPVYEPKLSPEIQQLIMLLRIGKVVKSFNPF